ncbi:MAG: hypothetical protein ABJP34_10605 [Erythrobacter sp.]
MTERAIKISGLFELEITLPDGLIIPFAANLGHAPTHEPVQEPEPDTVAAFPDTRNGYLAQRVAEFIKAAGPEGRSRTDISRQFASTIRNTAQRDAVLAMLPELLYRKSNDKHPSTGKLTGAERWTYFYSNEAEQ